MKSPYFIDQLAPAEHRARQKVVVARQVFRGALQHEVDAELKGPLIEGAC